MSLEQRPWWGWNHCQMCVDRGIWFSWKPRPLDTQHEWNVEILHSPFLQILFNIIRTRLIRITFEIAGKWNSTTHFGWTVRQTDCNGNWLWEIASGETFFSPEGQPMMFLLFRSEMKIAMVWVSTRICSCNWLPNATNATCNLRLDERETELET